MKNLGTFLRDRIEGSILAQPIGSDEFELSYFGEVQVLELRRWLNEFCQEFETHIDEHLQAQFVEGGQRWMMSVSFHPTRRKIMGSLRLIPEQMALDLVA